ncbi:MAG: sulfotransferase family protein [Planctomycetota bacterium]|jgi:hypothetical protein
MAIVKPIIIIGAGRSGSTIFQTLLAHHPDLAWMSGLCGRFPSKPVLNRFLLRLLEYPGLKGLLRTIIDPSECYPFWEYYCKGFTAPCRDLTTDDVTLRNKRALGDAMARLITKKKHRLLLKITGWPRLGFLNSIFQDAKFIHVLRDGRAVANSLINVGFWKGWMGPENWRWGPLPPEYEREWREADKSFIVLAGIQWKVLMDAVEAAKKCIPAESLLEVKYEDFCTDPIRVLKHVTDFCELDWPYEFEKRLRKYNLSSSNYKWKKQLTQHQQIQLEETVKSHLPRYGYASHIPQGQQ